MTEDFSGLRDKLDHLQRELAEKERRLTARGVLSSTARLEADALRIRYAQQAKLMKELANGSKYPESKAMIAAEIEALKLYISQWLALIDREYKVRP